MKSFQLSRLEIGHLWALVVVIWVFAFVNTQPIQPNDFWWHLATGREILTDGKIPLVDEYSYTAAGEPYPSYQTFWLAEIGLYGLYQLGGLQLVVLIFSLIITAAYTLLLWVCYWVSGSWRPAAVATFLAIAVGITNWSVRPQGISYLLGVLFLWAIYGYRRRPHPAWLAVFPLAMLVWANTHGSFPIGLVLLGIWLVDEAWRWLVARWRKEPDRSLLPLLVPAAALLLAGLACLVNPRGMGIVSYVRNLLSNSVVQNLITEWAPPTMDTQSGAIFIIAFLLGTLILILSPRRANFFQIVTYITFSLLAFKTTRGVIWFGLVMAPVYAEHLAAIARHLWPAGSRATHRPGRPAVNLAFMAILLMMALLSLPWMRRIVPLPGAKASIISPNTPVAATEYLLAERPPGQLFHEMVIGSYLIWAAQPDYPVFVDPRIELYSNQVWEDYIIITNALPGWEEYLERHGVRTLMLDPVGQAKLIKEVEASGAWRQVYRDQAAVIYTHR